MCRNITMLRGLQPPATPEETVAAARQYVRKVSGVQKTSRNTEAAFERAVMVVAEATTELLAALPPRRVPPRSEPPLRRLARTSSATVATANVHLIRRPTTPRVTHREHSIGMVEIGAQGPEFPALNP